MDNFKTRLERTLGLFDLGLRVAKCRFCTKWNVIQLSNNWPVFCHGHRVRLSLTLPEPRIISWSPKTGMSLPEVIAAKIERIRQPNWPPGEYIKLHYNIFTGQLESKADIVEQSGRMDKDPHVPIVVLARLQNWEVYKDS